MYKRQHNTLQGTYLLIVVMINDEIATFKIEYFAQNKKPVYITTTSPTVLPILAIGSLTQFSLFPSFVRGCHKDRCLSCPWWRYRHSKDRSCVSGVICSNGMCDMNCVCSFRMLLLCVGIFVVQEFVVFGLLCIRVEYPHCFDFCICVVCFNGWSVCNTFS